MARLRRYEVPDYPQHVIQRGNNCCETFTATEDFAFYLACLTDAAARTECAVHAYVLMTNHVHLLATPARPDGIARLMQSVGRRYVRYFNDTQRRTGTLWEGRYKATLIDSETYLFACHRYIESNPVRAGMVAVPADYPWSSHRANAQGAPSRVVSPHPGYLALGATPTLRQAAYRGLFDEPQDEATMTAIRDATNKAWVLGSQHFLEVISGLAGRRVAPAPRGRPRKENGL